MCCGIGWGFVSVKWVVFCVVNGVDCFPHSFAVCVVQIFNEEVLVVVGCVSFLLGSIFDCLGFLFVFW